MNKDTKTSQANSDNATTAAEKHFLLHPHCSIECNRFRKCSLSNNLPLIQSFIPPNLHFFFQRKNANRVCKTCQPLWSKCYKSVWKRSNRAAGFFCFCFFLIFIFETARQDLGLRLSLTGPSSPFIKVPLVSQQARDQRLIKGDNVSESHTEPRFDWCDAITAMLMFLRVSLIWLCAKFNWFPVKRTSVPL